MKQFLDAAKFWANHIIVADQASTDGTLQTLQSAAGVAVIKNEFTALRENAPRQQLLIDKARQIPGKRIFIALDADEALSSNCVGSREWNQINNAEPGTILRFHWVHLLPGFKQAWIPTERIACGFIDDGSEHKGQRTHSPRVPHPKHAPVIDLEEIVVLHFQYVDWGRMKRKHRWYQAWDHIELNQSRPLDIFREYHHMCGNWQKEEFHDLKPEWLEGFDRAGIDFRSIGSEPFTWWDKEIVGLLCKYGPGRFRQLDIWDEDWNAMSRRIGVKSVDLSDPRSVFEKAVHGLLAVTQKHRSNWGVRGAERILRTMGW